MDDKLNDLITQKEPRQKKKVIDKYGTDPENGIVQGFGGRFKEWFCTLNSSQKLTVTTKLVSKLLMTEQKQPYLKILQEMSPQFIVAQHFVNTYAADEFKMQFIKFLVCYFYTKS